MIMNEMMKTESLCGSCFAAVSLDSRVTHVSDRIPNYQTDMCERCGDRVAEVRIDTLPAVSKDGLILKHCELCDWGGYIANAEPYLCPNCGSKIARHRPYDGDSFGLSDDKHRQQDEKSVFKSSRNKGEIIWQI